MSMPFSSSKSIIRQSKDVAHQEVLGETVIVVPRKRTIHLLNAVGTAIWRAAKNGTTVRALVDDMVKRYRVRRAAAEKDCLQFIKELKRKGIIVVEKS
ncbi:MAG: PqqD family protein [Planctomycetota bacterium]|nr:PqqD family protein [Planctomycetota bacterium]